MRLSDPPDLAAGPLADDPRAGEPSGAWGTLRLQLYDPGQAARLADRRRGEGNHLDQQDLLYRLSCEDSWREL